MGDHDGLICAYVLDGQGGGRPLDWPEIAAKPEGVVWLHLHPGGTKAKQWLEKESGIDPILLEALLAEERQPPRGVAEAQLPPPLPGALPLCPPGRWARLQGAQPTG